MWDYKPVVDRGYLKAVEELKDIPVELKRSLATHERMNTFKDNMVKQLTLIQERRLKLGKKPFAIESINGLIKDMVEVFARNAKTYADNVVKSDIEKYKRLHAEDEKEEMESTLQGNAKGAYEDLGLKIGETKVEDLGDEV